MATETTESNLFASLLDEAAPEGADEDAQDTSEQATGESTEATASDKGEQATGDEDEILDALSKDESEDEDWDGKSPLNEHPRFKKLITQRNEERDARKESEARLSELEKSTELFQEHYSAFENPEQQFRLDTQFIKAMDTLYSKEIEVVQKAAVIVNEFIKTGKVIEGQAVEGKPRMSESKSDAANNNVARELWSDRVDALLEATAIKQEFKTVIRKHAVGAFDGKTLSKAQAKEVIGEYIKENGWSADILTGKQAKPASNGKPAAAKPAKRVETSTKPQTTPSKEEATSPDDLRAQMRANLQDLLTQSS